MRQLTLDEKISIKGKLAPKGVNPRRLVSLDTSEAVRLYWMCFGVPASMHSTPKMWRKKLRRSRTLH